MKNSKPLMLLILDGWGYREEIEGNAIALAKTTNWDFITKNHPMTLLNCSGNEVGLPEGIMGNSEVGHLNLGAGRIVYQDITRIDLAIKDKTFFENEAFLGAFEFAKKNNGKVHLMGLVSDGGVHTAENHYLALIDLADKLDFSRICFHAFMDGRDTPPTSGKNYLETLDKKLKNSGRGRIVSISGRFYAMDRDKRWERIEKAYRCIVFGEGEIFNNANEAILSSYNNDKTDEFVIPCLIKDENGKIEKIEDGDSVIFFNFRADRGRELSHALTDDEFTFFDRGKKLNLFYVTMTDYDKTLKNVKIAFPQQSLKRILGEVLAENGLKQLRIAETEKYAHVTFFFNGGIETPFENEDRILIPSPKVETYDLQPEMSAPQVTEKLIEQIKKDEYDVFIVNFANPDMVGHTGNLEAAIKAIEEIDKDLGLIYETMKEKKGIILLTADHGNSEMMIDPVTKEIFTAHTTNKVPFVLIDFENNNHTLRENCKLADIAPTMLELLNIPIPEEMTGTSLLLK